MRPDKSHVRGNMGGPSAGVEVVRPEETDLEHLRPHRFDLGAHRGLGDLECPAISTPTMRHLFVWKGTGGDVGDRWETTNGAVLFSIVKLENHSVLHSD